MKGNSERKSSASGWILIIFFIHAYELGDTSVFEFLYWQRTPPQGVKTIIAYRRTYTRLSYMTIYRNNRLRNSLITLFVKNVSLHNLNFRFQLLRHRRRNYFPNHQTNRQKSQLTLRRNSFFITEYSNFLSEYPVVYQNVLYSQLPLSYCLW